MGKGLNKEQALFIIGGVLLAWVGLKLGLFLAHHEVPPKTPKVTAPEIQHGDPDMRARLSIPSLDRYGGPRDFFFDDVSQPTTLYVRSTVIHNLSSRLGALNRYTFDCHMTPHRATELRFRLPPATKPEQVFCRQMPPGASWGQDGRIVSVPVLPIPIKRTYYRCQVDIVLRSPLGTLPTQWQAPVVSCRDGMAKLGNVVSESGNVALVTLRNSVELIPLSEQHRTGLQLLAGDSIPERLRSSYTKFVYHFKEPGYKLVFRIQSKVVVAAKPKPGAKPKPKPKPMPGAKPMPGEKPKPKPPPDAKLDIPPPPGDDLGFKLVAIVQIEAPEPKRQAVLRHKESGEYYRKFTGDSLNGLKLDSITDDAVILVDAKGKRHKLRGRFEDKYNE